ncbi:MAG TPA: hypothetical protein VED01_02920 [Burkholderiales bacterium]|nr:hypothetical protein [Burkholderiales bacterium]
MAAAQTRPDVILAALLYLLTAYRSRPCPGLASCIARHFSYLAQHPRADRLVCDVAAASVAEWENAARASVEHSRPVGWVESLLH